MISQNAVEKTVHNLENRLLSFAGEEKAKRIYSNGSHVLGQQMTRPKLDAKGLWKSSLDLQPPPSHYLQDGMSM